MPDIEAVKGLVSNCLEPCRVGASIHLTMKQCWHPILAVLSQISFQKVGKRFGKPCGVLKHESMDTALHQSQLPGNRTLMCRMPRSWGLPEVSVIRCMTSGAGGNMRESLCPAYRVSLLTFVGCRRASSWATIDPVDQPKKRVPVCGRTLTAMVVITRKSCESDACVNVSK